MREIEEDKKALIAMLGKLYITSNSTADKLSTVSQLVIDAIDTKIASDAASKSALNKLHLALSKAIGETGKAKKTADEIEMPVAEEEGTQVEGEESVLPAVKDVKMEVDEGVTERDSVLEELLGDEDEDL